MHHFAKFRQNRSKRGRDMAILDFSRWRPPPSCIFEISRGLNYIIMPNFVEIAQTVADIWLFFDF